MEEIIKILYFYRSRVIFSFSGVALGILSICVIITTIDGANKRANDMAEALGPDSIMIFSGGERQRAARERTNTLTMDDAASIERIGGVYDLLKSFTVRNVMIRYRDGKWQSAVVGATENYFTSFSWGFQTGAPFARQDVENAEAVCVLGSKIYDELFKGESAVGKSILVGQLPTKVIGILEEKGGGMGGRTLMTV
ncbi:MAG: hypothetical protein C0399_11510 [Syntrophus sp. (in: bacteria)]|nr:hypothetical protein [Syntrophus sp. (in: bacteria)]MBA4418942.1 hypothetical protein [Syntrophus sp. (in: bacteria)]